MKFIKKNKEIFLGILLATVLSLIIQPSRENYYDYLIFFCLSGLCLCKFSADLMKGLLLISKTGIMVKLNGTGIIKKRKKCIDKSFSYSVCILVIVGFELFLDLIGWKQSFVPMISCLTVLLGYDIYLFIKANNRLQDILRIAVSEDVPRLTAEDIIIFKEQLENSVTHLKED
ncbi:hypothetical protein [Peptostreptococcus faecalis]|uniref:hypothetical protein n=1 Tax=Peptostreptococcus faecalis TaxID=2045015 RepID=UPI000C7D3852|nr:hypothetical protein [Peptostreptococcus faecalis]